MFREGIDMERFMVPIIMLMAIGCTLTAISAVVALAIWFHKLFGADGPLLILPLIGIVSLSVGLFMLFLGMRRKKLDAVRDRINGANQ